MTDEKGYNGWKNYETWAVGMYLDGNYTSSVTYEDAIAVVESVLSQNHPTSEYWTVEQSMQYTVENALEQFMEDELESEGIGGFWHDCATSFLSSVDWREIAEAWIANVREMQNV